MTKLFGKIHFILSLVPMVLLAGAFAGRDRYGWMLIIFLIWLARTIGIRRAGSAPFAAALLVNTALSGYGLFLGVNPFLLLAVITVSLTVWDLDNFNLKMKQAESIHDPAVMIKNHFNRLVIVAVLGFGLGAAAISARLELGLGWLILFGLVVLIGLVKVFDYLNLKSPSPANRD